MIVRRLRDREGSWGHEDKETKDAARFVRSSDT